LLYQMSYRGGDAGSRTRRGNHCHRRTAVQHGAAYPATTGGPGTGHRGG